MTTILLRTRCALMWNMWDYREIIQRSFMFIFSLPDNGKMPPAKLIKICLIWYCIFLHIVGKLRFPQAYDSVRNQIQKCVALAQQNFPYMLRSYVTKYSLLLSFQSLIQKSSSLGFWCILTVRFLNSFEIVEIFKSIELNYYTLGKPSWKLGEVASTQCYLWAQEYPLHYLFTDSAAEWMHYLFTDLAAEWMQT